MYLYIIFPECAVSLSVRVQRKPLRLSLSSSVPYENITRESKFDNSVCETTVSEHMPTIFFFFRLCLPHYRETPNSVSLLLSPPAHPIDSLSPCTSLLDSQFETRFLSMERTAVVQSNCSDCPYNVFSTLLFGLRLSETLLNYWFQKPQI